MTHDLYKFMVDIHFHAERRRRANYSLPQDPAVVSIEYVRLLREGDVTRQQSPLKSGTRTSVYLSVECAQTQASEACRYESATAEIGTVKINPSLGTTRSLVCPTVFPYAW